MILFEYLRYPPNAQQRVVAGKLPAGAWSKNAIIQNRISKSNQTDNRD